VTNLADPRSGRHPLDLTVRGRGSPTARLAEQLGPRGITANSVAPGIVDTDVNAGWLRGNAAAEAHAASLAALLLAATRTGLFTRQNGDELTNNKVSRYVAASSPAPLGARENVNE
jgi:NAD(P)-dependent dehydrogenase (short-subunit alcohol dehydrogenase family)